ncbi:MAG: tetratricopeptide repeat protein, partial [Acidobacteria bacterium]|nr:tetratricopeptide repeat protein [Acidobacteriota bacterium]
LRAVRAYELGRYEKAAGACDFALSVRRNSGISNFNMGAALYRKGDYERAAAFFEKAAASDDADLSQKALYNLGNCRFRLAERQSDAKEAARLYRKSLDDYGRAAALDPRDDDATFNKGFVEKKLREHLDGRHAVDRKNPEDGESGRRDVLGGQVAHGRDSLAGLQKAGSERVDRKDAGDDPTGERSEKGRGTGRIEFKKGEMSREDAELLLEAFGRREQGGTIPAGEASAGREREVEKDW